MHFFFVYYVVVLGVFESGSDVSHSISLRGLFVCWLVVFFFLFVIAGFITRRRCDMKFNKIKQC